MTASETTVHLRNGRRVAIQPRNGFWYGEDQSAWTKAGLISKLEAKHAQKDKAKADKRPWWYL
jgi:hypothetical protein